MPLVAHNNLPSYERLRKEGYRILSPERARDQNIRALHIGLLNMMPDAALEATERQFFRLVGSSNPISQFCIHPFTLDEIPRGAAAKQHISQFYEPFSTIKELGLDALIISGANVTQPDLSREVFWKPLLKVIDWADANVTSTLCSCLATHAVLLARYNIKRKALERKCWGVYEHDVVRKNHPLVQDVNTRLFVPHSRFNEVDANHYEHNSVGIFLMYSDSVVVKNNYIAYANGPTGMGIGFKETSGVEIANNQILYCSTGLYIDVSPFQPDMTNSIHDNVIAFTSIAIDFLNDWTGNTFERNSFKGNQIQISVAGGKTANRNIWQGNYWDDYEGFDLDNDGVGDKPYELYSYADRIWMDVPAARFLQGTPVMAVLDFLERLAPFSTPDMLVRDKSPLMAAPEYTTSSESKVSSALSAMLEL